MARRQRRINEAKHEHWRGVLRQWRASGLKVRRFCERHRIRESQFWWWRRRLEESPASDGQPAFVPVTLVEPCEPARAAIDIRLSSGHRLRVRSGCDRQLLADVVAVLEGQPC